MKRIVIASLFALAGLSGLVVARADKPAGPRDTAVSHRIIVQDKGRTLILGPTGQIEWEMPCNYTSHDISVLPNGNVLLNTGPRTIEEVTPSKEVVWKWEAKPKAPYSGDVQIHGFQRLKNGNTMIGETGNLRIIEVDKDSNIVKEVPLTVDHEDPHRDTRLVRKLDNGHYLVAHEGDGKVREYDEKGAVVWTYTMDLVGKPATGGHDGHGINVFGAVRLKNGNTMIAGGNNNRVFEVTPAGKTVWSIEQDELPGIHLCWITHLEVLPNGDVVFGNSHAGPNNPQIVEVNHDKKVVWTLKNWDILGNDVATAQVLDVKGKVLR
ncbi:MAG: Arylsulfotransferase [Chthonomonadaceae bacterium]|nr:Arylsulfotransferase [Chthonomonadaceae bacterium]